MARSPISRLFPVFPKSPAKRCWQKSDAADPDADPHHTRNVLVALIFDTLKQLIVSSSSFGLCPTEKIGLVVLDAAITVVAVGKHTASVAYVVGGQLAIARRLANGVSRQSKRY